MFEKIGRHIDTLITKISIWNRKRFWYTFYAYWTCKKLNDPEFSKATYEAGYLHDWQYKRLKQVKTERK